MHPSLLLLLALLAPLTSTSLIPTHPLLARDPSSNPLSIRAVTNPLNLLSLPPFTNTLSLPPLTNPFSLRPLTNPLSLPVSPPHRQPTPCPNYATSPINPSTYLGADPTGCSWKGALICANLLVACPAVCISAALEIGVNPFTDVPCLSCLGYGVGSCAECFVAVGGFPALCAASRKLPRSYAGCLVGTCLKGVKGVGSGVAPVGTA